MHFALHCDIFYQYVHVSRVRGAKAWRFTDEKNEKNVEPSTTIPSATTHHHPLPVEGRPQPTCLRSVARTARKPPRPAREAPLTAMPAAPAVYAQRLGPASSAYVLLPAQVSRLRRLPFAAVAHSGCAVCPSRRCAYTAYALGMACRKVDVRRSGRFLAAARTPLRRMGCCSFVLVRGWWWGVDVLAALTEEWRARLRGGVALGLPHGRSALANGAPDPRGNRSSRRPRSRLAAASRHS